MKERKGLHPAIAFLLMLVMLCCSLLYGAHKHWRDEQVNMIRQTQALEAELSVRAETAHNLLTVAYRHLPKDDALCVAVKESAEALKDTALPLGERMTACTLLTEKAQLLLSAVSSLDSVQADSREQTYAALILPQAVEQFDDTTAFSAYEAAVNAYNTELKGSFSGVLAKVLGYRTAPELHKADRVLAVVDVITAYPTQRSYVNDDAAVLSAETAKDIIELNDRMDMAEFTVATKHFLGGADVKEYAKGLFDYWGLDTDDVLVLLVIGEEKYAVITGDLIEEYVSKEQLSSLMGTQLRQAFITERDYDGAVGDFLLALASQIDRFTGEDVDFGGLFGMEETVDSQIFDNWGGNWWEGFFGEYDYDESDLKVYAADDVHEAYDVDFSSLFVLAAVLLIVVRRRRKSGKGGLGWFGWILVLSLLSDIGNMLGQIL